MATAVSQKKGVAYYCSNNANGHARANSAVLLCAYMVFALGFPPEKAYSPFFGLARPFTPFRDAAFALNTWPLFVLDCCCAFSRAVSCGHFVYSQFDVDKFEFMAQLHNGDMSWIVPGKLLAFSGPLAKRKELASGKFTMTPEDYIAPFKALNVQCVVRFNNKCYDRRSFLNGGVAHVDMFYEDGANPTEAILQQFLALAETQAGAIAVHCKAGLGRTGTNICAYMVKHLGYSVREAIAWHRICRPGAVVGPQQQYLCSIEDKLKMEGAQFYAKQAAAKARAGGVSPTSPVPVPVRRGSKDRGALGQGQGQGQGQLPERKNSLTNKLAQLNI
jgi:cell division cycle 14